MIIKDDYNDQFGVTLEALPREDDEFLLEQGDDENSLDFMMRICGFDSYTDVQLREITNM